MRVKVSVIIPVYNAEKYLKQCMDSIINQTLKDIEIICVDDGSSDRSLHILKEYQKNDNRVQIYTQKNQYAGVARNNGMKYATGKYVIFWDADDYFEADCLEKLYIKAEQTNADIVVCESMAYDNEYGKDMHWNTSIVNKYLPDKDIFSAEDIPDSIFMFCVAWAWDKLFNLEFVRKHNLEYRNTKVAEEQNFVFIGLIMAQRITTIRNPLVHYRKFNSNSLENSKNDCWINTITMFDDLYEKLCEKKCDIDFRRSYDNYILMHMLTVVTSLGDICEYRKMYDMLKNEIIPRYKLTKHDSEYYYEKYWYDRLCEIDEYSADEYLMKDMRACGKDNERLNSYLTQTWEMLEGYIRCCKHKQWPFPYNKIPAKSKVIIYGAGDVGQDYYKQIRDTDWCQLVAWVDRNASLYREKGMAVETVDTLCTLKYDYIVIALVNEAVASAIKLQLCEKGVSPNCIIWNDKNAY